MEFIKSWIVTIFINIVFCIISEFFILDNKFQKLVNSLLGTYFLINLLTPFKNFKFPKIDLHTNNATKVEVQKNKLEQRIDQIAKNKIKEQIHSFLLQNGIKAKNIIIHINKNSQVTCDISFDKGVENKESVLKSLKNKFKINFYSKN